MNCCGGGQYGIAEVDCGESVCRKLDGDFVCGVCKAYFLVHLMYQISGDLQVRRSGLICRRRTVVEAANRAWRGLVVETLWAENSTTILSVVHCPMMQWYNGTIIQ